MKIFVLFLNNIFSSLRTFAASHLRLAKLQARYPTCRFYPGAYIDESSSLGKYNILFGDVSIMDSTVGDHTFIQKGSRVCCADIGKFCSIAMGVTVGLGRHPISHVSTHPAFYSLSQPLAKTFSDGDHFKPFERTTIGHDVWLGENAIIKDGVKIGIGAVVGAGAVVTGDVPAYAVVAGVPARLIRYRFDEDLRQRLLASAWWDMPEEWLRENSKLFAEPEKFVRFFDRRG
jgi:acetyltransferase-like isoleucine patch superfamily enzyme